VAVELLTNFPYCIWLWRKIWSLCSVKRSWTEVPHYWPPWGIAPWVGWCGGLLVSGLPCQNIGGWALNGMSDWAYTLRRGNSVLSVIGCVKGFWKPSAPPVELLYHILWLCVIRSEHIYVARPENLQRLSPPLGLRAKSIPAKLPRQKMG